MRKVLKALLLTILAYLFQVCAMNQLKIGGVVANLLAVNIAILTVSLGKKYAFGASCVTGILLEVMTSTVGGFYAVIYPAVSMLFAQFFSDMSDEKREIRRNREKNTRDVNPHIRIPLDAMCIAAVGKHREHSLAFPGQIYAAVCYSCQRRSLAPEPGPASTSGNVAQCLDIGQAVI